MNSATSIRQLFTNFYNKKIAFRQWLNPFYKNRDFISLQNWMISCQAPHKLTKSAEFPAKIDPEWGDNSQGAAHDDQYWYFTNRHNLFKIPLTTKITSKTKKSNNAGIPSRLYQNGKGYDHMGDIDIYQNKVFVPLEGKRPPKIAVHDCQTLKCLYDYDIKNDDQHGFPWCAIDPKTKRLFTSNFDFDSKEGLFVYQLETKGKEITGVHFLDRFPLFDSNFQNFKLKRIQGGCFSPNGNLYLLSDSRDGDAGLLGFDMYTGRQFVYKKIIKRTNYIPFPGGAIFEGDELEGITYCNLTPDQNPIASTPGINGKLHVTMVDKDLFTDNFYFKHFDASDSNKSNFI
ncbi:MULTISPECIES: hypothetical protein [Aquimarina]|uniref:hypothetical protein n=1 Tax=Aquimarina TaxID=290174 RepID=UPI000D6930B1|nr:MULTISPECIES: hypothetical protein [Aquimarina]